MKEILILPTVILILSKSVIEYLKVKLNVELEPILQT